MDLKIFVSLFIISFRSSLCCDFEYLAGFVVPSIVLVLGHVIPPGYIYGPTVAAMVVC